MANLQKIFHTASLRCSFFGSTERHIFWLALPSVVANITIPLMGMVDVGIMGHIGNASYIAAIAVGSTLLNVLYWLLGFLRMGTGGLTSQQYGARNLAEVAHVLLRSMLIAFGLGLMIVLLRYLIIRLGFSVIKPAADVAPLCLTYCGICFLGAPAQLGQLCFTGWYVGLQNTRIPMVVSILQNAINIVASLLLVIVGHYGIVGVALGTIMAQWLAFLLSVAAAWHYYGRVFRYASVRGCFHRNSFARFFSVNRDIFIRTVFHVSVFLFFTAAGSREGSLLLAVNTLLMQLFTFFSYFCDGFAYAGEAMCGRYYGARNGAAFSSTVKALFHWGWALTLVFTLVYLLGGYHFLSLLTSDRHVIFAAIPYLPWAVLIPLSGIAAFIYDGVFVGITQTRVLLLSSVLAALAYYAVYLLLHPLWGNHALWLAFLLYLAVRGVVEHVYYSRNKRKLFAA